MTIFRSMTGLFLAFSIIIIFALSSSCGFGGKDAGSTATYKSIWEAVYGGTPPYQQELIDITPK